MKLDRKSREASRKAIKRNREKGKKHQKKQILSDHQRKGKELIPPLVGVLSDKLVHVRWIDNLLPDIIWIGLLQDMRIELRGAEVALKCAEETNKILKPKKIRSFAFISDYRDINASQAEMIKRNLANEGVLNDLQSCLFPLISLYPKCPFGILFDDHSLDAYKVNSDTALDTMKRVVRDCFNRQGLPATIVQTIAVYIMLVTGKLRVLQGVGFENPYVILDYPFTEESQNLASVVRSTLNAVECEKSRNKNLWCSYFWQRGYEISTCEFSDSSPHPSDSANTIESSDILRAAHTYREELFEEILYRWNLAFIDLAQPLKDEILGGLIARQARLATVITTDPNSWAVDIGRILLRCMVDTHITLVWLAFKGTEEDVQQFFQYGLGQEKLLLEHLSSRLDERDPKLASLREEVEGMRTWINSQIITDFLPVNVGSWTKKSTREMAEETNCLDMYNLGYSPFSSTVHGMWNTISRVNLTYCTNPLHRFHGVPSLEDPPMYLGIIEYALQVMDESLRAWEQAKGIQGLELAASAGFRKTLRTYFS